MSVIEAIEARDEARARRLAAEHPGAARERDARGVSAPLLALYHGLGRLAAELLPDDAELDVFEAAAFGRVEPLRRLLDRDPALANAWAPDGFQPLGLACFFGRVDAARLLVERGADVESRARNERIKTTPLQAAVAGAVPDARHEIASLLLDHGADPNAELEGGFTPLDAAEQNRDARLREVLLAHGARPRAG